MKGVGTKRAEKPERWKAMIRAKTHARLQPQVEISEQKIIRVFLSQQKELGFNYIADATKTEFSRAICNKYLKGLVEKGIITKVRGKGKRERYSLNLIPDRAAFQVRATSFLHQSLVSNDIDLFNKRLGSLIVYILKVHKEDALTILVPIISQIEAYINLPKTLMGENILIAEPEVQSVEWDTWKEFDKPSSKALNCDDLSKLA